MPKNTSYEHITITMKQSTIIISVIAFCISVFFSSCNKGEVITELQVSPAGASLQVGETQRFESNMEGTVFTVEDPFYASVEFDGTVTARKIGETRMIASYQEQTKEIFIGVRPSYQFYDMAENPDLSGMIGCSREAFLSTRPYLYDDLDVYDIESPYSFNEVTEEYKGLIYGARRSFTFKNDVCVSIVVSIPVVYSSIISAVLNEWYEYGGVDKEIMYFFNHDKNVMIGLSAKIYQDFSGRFISYAYVPYDGK